MAAERIRTSFDGEVAYITLDHPPVNVIDFAMIAELKTYLRGLGEERRLCAVVFQGTGRAFSGGVDIASHLPETVDAMIREFHSVFEALDELAVPTMALVRGACLGGACELAGYLDLVIATENARFGVPEIKLGVFPPVAAALFPRRFGYQGAMQLLFTGDIIDAASAVRVGLVSRLVSEADAALALEETLQSYRVKSASSLRIVKRATLRARGYTFRELVAPSEEVYLEQLMATADSVEGLRAYLEKRDPAWQHG
jgi:cyclohexa-1,5-dienecarbonyl-CoA hydratase